MFNKTLLATGFAVAIGIGTAATTLAHNPNMNSTNQPSGFLMGPMMGSGQGMGQGYGMNPGQGMGQGYHMNPGQGMGQGYHMNPGQGMGQSYGMNPGQGMGQGYGMNPGQGMGQNYGMNPGQGMGRGYQMNPGQGGMPPLRQDLSTDDVKHILGHRLAWNGNSNVKVGQVEDKDEDTIFAEIVTQDGSLVQKLEVNRHTGEMRPIQ